MSGLSSDNDTSDWNGQPSERARIGLRGPTVKPHDLDDTQWKALLEGLAVAEYSLILGAGASLGAKNAAGSDLLSGDGLRDELLEHYGIPGGEDQSLRSIYDTAVLLAQNNGVVAPRELISPWFSGCSVPDWYGNLVTIPWRVIWNLNIDDVLTNAYMHRFRNRARQELRQMSWRDRWTTSREPLNKVSAIHLHGDAKNRDVIFGSLEYLATARDGGAAHQIFWDDWANSSPTVVVGASLVDELDLARPLLSDLSSDRPSIIVRPNFTDFESFRLRQSGLIPVRMTGEEFFAAVQEDWEQTLSAIEKSRISGTLDIHPTTLYFLRSFRMPVGDTDRWHDFYAGEEPTWSDIQNELDARRVLPSHPNPNATLGGKGLSVYAFHGELSGTTTAEMRFLSEVSKAGHEVLEYVGEGQFDPRAIHWMAKQGMRRVLRIPRLEDFADAAAELERLCNGSGTPVALVTSIRSSRVDSLRLQLNSSLKLFRVPDRLSHAEIAAMLEKLEAKNRLNVLLDKSDAERHDFVAKTHRSSLIDSMAAITHGKSFAARYQEAYRDVSQPLDCRILDIIMVASEARSDLSFGLLARAARASVTDLRSALSSSPLVRLVRRTRAGVSARHWGLAAQASRRVLTADRRYRATVETLLAAGPYVHPTTISQRTKEVLLCARLMDAKRVVDAFGSERGAELYGELEAEFGWNSRFWEQRSLAELEAISPRWERAEAWAREAVLRHKDGLSLNTLATVLLRRSTSDGELDEDLFFQGLEAVDGARLKSRDRVTEHPYVTAFHYLQLGRSLARDAGTQRRIDVIFNYWRLEVETSLAWSHPTVRSDIETRIRRYVALPPEV